MFDPGFRYSVPEIKRQAENLLNSSYLSVLLEDIPGIILIINNARQLVYANKALVNELALEGDHELWGYRPGECLNCVRAFNCAYGCGSTAYCKVCGFANAIGISEQGNRSTGECNIINKEGKTLSYSVSTRPFSFEDQSYIFCYMQELSDLKAHQYLEKTFLHDIQNSLGVLYAMHDVLDEMDKDEIRSTLKSITRKLNQEINSYKIIKDAEDNMLSLRKEPVEITQQIKEVISELQTIKAFRNRTVEMVANPQTLWTDNTLLRRILMNLLKNAMEASVDDEVISVFTEQEEDNACSIHVKSQPVIPEEVQLQLFQKSFSTKGKGRGWGTYSIKLLTEKYLGGQADFVSDQMHRTVFTVRIPDMNPAKEA